MIKPKLLFATVFIFLAFLVVIISALKISQPYILNYISFTPQTKLDLKNPTKQSNHSQKNTDFILFDYQLPYPGILPSHPLYWLKMIRDRIKIYLTKDPINRFYLYILLSDKRLSSGLILIKSGQFQLGTTTITKAEKYLNKATIYLLDNLNQPEKNSHLFYQTVKTFFKHKKEIISIYPYINDDQKNILNNLIETNESLIQNKLGNYYDNFKSPIPEASVSAQ